MKGTKKNQRHCNYNLTTNLLIKWSYFEKPSLSDLSRVFEFLSLPTNTPREKNDNLCVSSWLCLRYCAETSQLSTSQVELIIREIASADFFFWYRQRRCHCSRVRHDESQTYSRNRVMYSLEQVDQVRGELSYISCLDMMNGCLPSSSQSLPWPS